MDISEAKNLVIKAGKELSQTGLIARTWGNVSCRTGEDSFVITASGRNYMTLTEQEVVEVNISDLSYQGDIKPSSEKKVHREIYKLCPEVNFIIHTHQDNASAVAAMGSGIIKLAKSYKGIGDEVIVAEYGLPGTDKLCRGAAEAVRKAKGNAIILANHGTVCYGKTYEEAFATAHMLEEACAEYLAKKMPETTAYWTMPANCEAHFDQTEHAGMTGIEAISAGGEQHGPQQEMQLKNGTYRLTNADKAVADFSKLGITLRPYVDDFAQIVGTKVKPARAGVQKITDDVGQPDVKALQGLKEDNPKTPVVFVNGGAVCYGETPDDAEAVSMILTKNCMAYFAARAAGAKPISRFDSMIMRRVYLKKYSKQMKKEI